VTQQTAVSLLLCEMLKERFMLKKLMFAAEKIVYTSVSQPSTDRGPVNSFFIGRGPGPNKFTRKYLSIF